MTVYIGECARSTAEYLNGTPLGFGTSNLLLLAGIIVLAFLLVLHFAGGVRYKWARDVRIAVYGYATTLLLLYLHEVRSQPQRSQLAYELCSIEPASGLPIRPYNPPGVPTSAPIAPSVSAVPAASAAAVPVAPPAVPTFVPATAPAVAPAAMPISAPAAPAYPPQPVGQYQTTYNI